MDNKKVVCIVQARMGSSRLPDKVLLPILDKPMLWHIINRLNYSNLIDETIIATTFHNKDIPIIEMAKENNILYYAGKEDDLVDRFYQSAKIFNADVVVRITADCPLIDPKITDKLINIFLDGNGSFDYVSNCRPYHTFPHGLDVEVFSFSLLEVLCKKIEDSFRREWFTTEIFENPKKYNIFCMKNDIDLSRIRLTVDYEEDLEVIRFIYKNLYRENKCFFLEDILKLLKENPNILDINKKYYRDEQYFDELKRRNLL